MTFAIGQKENPDLFRTIVKDSNDAIIVVDFEANILFWNRGAEKIYGYSEAEANKMKITRIIPEGQQNEAEHFYNLIKEKKLIESFETKRMTKDGRILDVWLTATLLHNETGQPVAITKTVRDITERKRKEEELKRSNEELDDFAYIASHDLREPLRGIHSSAKFLGEDYADKLDASGKERLIRLQHLCERLDAFIETLLQYSRLGRTELRLSKINMNEIVDSVVDDLDLLLTQNSIQIKIPRQLPSIVCDKIRAKEIFQNLISNAVKYNDKETKWIEIGYLDNNNVDFHHHLDKQGLTGFPGVIFFVKDNGMGIAKKNQEKVFKLFKRLHGREKFGGGVGAGLTIVKKMVEKQNGKVWVDSTESEGSTFYFTLIPGGFNGSTKNSNNLDCRRQSGRL